MTKSMEAQGDLYKMPEAKRLKAMLQESEDARQLAEAVRNSPVVVVVTDIQGNIQYANPRFFSLTGYTPEEVLGKNTRLFKSGLHTSAFYKELWETITQGRIWRGVFQNRKKNGEIYWEKASISSVRDATGKITSYVAVKEDITVIRRQQLELEEAKERAERANQAKSDFLANISHEIRTPLNAIVGFSHLALKTQLTEEQRDYLERIGEAGKTLLQTLNAVLDFSKIEAGRMELETTPFRLQTLLTEKAAMIRGLAAAKGLQVETLIDERLSPVFYGDSLRVGQILLNLISNAVKFTETGKITIQAVWLGWDKKREKVRFSVIDTGIGIPEEARERIFEAFRQGDNSTTRRFGGTGLGLGIAEQLVKLMGGVITLESEVGKGSNFSFSLWLEPADEALLTADEMKKTAQDLPARQVAKNSDATCEWARFQKQLRNLQQLLQEHDGDAWLFFQKMLPQFSLCGVAINQVQALEAALRRFAFSEADRILTEIRKGASTGG